MSEPEGLDDYIECALWSSHDMRDGAEYQLDDWVGDLGPGVREALAQDLDSFFCDHEVQALIAQTGMGWEQAAHDFWLTRNHHGAGFWDRGNGAAGDRLSELTYAYGGQDLYIGDDGLIWAAGLEPPRPSGDELHDRYTAWCSNRERLSAMEDEDEHASANEWQWSDDDATELMHLMATRLGFCAPVVTSEPSTAATGTGRKK